MLCLRSAFRNFLFGGFIALLALTVSSNNAFANPTCGAGEAIFCDAQHSCTCLPDADGDGVPDQWDNCINTPNPDQSDDDGDGEGDACESDADTDGDGVRDPDDNCVTTPNPGQGDYDGDGEGDACDDDIDGDGIPNDPDNCPLIPNPDQTDTDGDGVGDVCDSDDDPNNDIDNDGIPNDDDNCPSIPNPNQEDLDGDGDGDVCDDDRDGDGIPNDPDNCPDNPNPDQTDTDGDGIGDACDDTDQDDDGIPDVDDNCPNTPNPNQEDLDGDGEGDACDDDRDGDGIPNDPDNCPDNPNPDQTDTDGDGIGDVCDDTDQDDDGIPDDQDNCPNVPNPNQEDTDGDGTGDACDADAQCQYYTGFAINRWKSSGNKRRFNRQRSFTSEDGNRTADEVEALGCVQNLIQQADDFVRPDGRHHRVRRKRGHVIQVYEKGGNNYDSMLRDFFYDFARQSQGLADDFHFQSDVPYEFLMDRNCNPVPLNSVPQNLICGSFTISAITSPISLIWEEGTDINAHRSVVNFPLNPNEKGKYYSWKASAETPLLVFDPEHTGVITSASQLFGEWTFGGKRTASMAATHSKTAWRDGYEALETLDQNGDGEISGSELAPLGLWFDANRDGVSQPGEVQTVEDAGVSKLFYTADSRDEETGDIHASVGFERAVDGVIVKGASVDWYGEHADSQMELIAKEQARALLGSGVSLETSTEQEVPAKSVASSDISGVWKWATGSIEATGGKHSGYLSLQSQEGFGLIGRSFIESAIQPNGSNEHNLNSLVVVAPLSGTYTPKLSGKTALKFTVRGSKGMRTVTEATLSANGTRLEGQSTLTKNTGEKISYRWTASRVL